MPKVKKSYETERLFIIPTKEEDAAFIYELMNTPKFLKYIGDRNIKTVNDAANYIKERMIPQLNRLGFSNYTLIRKSDNCKVGTCGLYDREGLEGVDIGFAFLPAYENKGYGFEASSKLLELAFTCFGISEVKAITTKDNIPSQRLLEKLGLKNEGTTRIPDDEEELLLFVLKRNS